jgi:hypothetical protein
MPSRRLRCMKIATEVRRVLGSVLISKTNFMNERGLIRRSGRSVESKGDEGIRCGAGGRECRNNQS